MADCPALPQPLTNGRVHALNPTREGNIDNLAAFFQQQTGCCKDDAFVYALQLFDAPVLAGYDSHFFLLQRALECGLKINDAYLDALHFVVETSAPWTPGHLSGKWESKAPTEWCARLSEKKNRMYPNNFYACQLKRNNGKMTKDAGEAISSLADKMKVKESDLIYRGLHSGELLFNIRNRWQNFSDRNEKSEFGPGLYLTPSLSVACAYASGNRTAIAIFNWSDQGGKEVLNRTHFFTASNGKDWKTFVKRNACLDSLSCPVTSQSNTATFFPPLDTVAQFPATTAR